MSTPGESRPSTEPKVASDAVEETVLTVEEKKEEIEKAPVGNYWVRFPHSARSNALLTDYSAFFPFERSKMDLLYSLDLVARQGLEL